MIEIQDKDKFGKVVADALANVELNGKDASAKKRWINAIAKATVEIEQNGVFMTWQSEESSLLIWSQKSNQIYTANGVCQCRAFEKGLPCFHRAAARLVRLYFEPAQNSIEDAQNKESEHLQLNHSNTIVYSHSSTEDAQDAQCEQVQEKGEHLQSEIPYLKPTIPRKAEFVGKIRIN